MISYVDKWGNGRGQIFASLVRRWCRIRLGSSCVAVEICAHPVVSDFRHLEPLRCNSQKANYAVPMAPLETHGFRWGFKIQSPVCAGWTYVNIQIAWIYDDSWMFIPPEIWYCRFWLSKLWCHESWATNQKEKHVLYALHEFVRTAWNYHVQPTKVLQYIQYIHYPPWGSHFPGSGNSKMEDHSSMLLNICVL